MDGFLSNNIRDAIAVIGLLLGVLQFLMAVLSSSGSKSQRRFPAQEPRSGVLERFLLELRKPGRIFENPREFRKVVAVFIGLGIIVFVSFYILTPSDMEHPSSFQAVVFFVAMISLNIQVLLLFCFIAATQEILEDYSEVFDKFFNTGEGAFAYGVISLVVLSVSSLLLRWLYSNQIWFIVAFKAYLWAALVWSCLILIATTIFGVIETTKIILKKG